jgi:uncharacterized tellurite resistance protein B-like protein
MTLAKVIIAAAWADGDISHEEVNSLKDLLFRLPDLNATQWAELDIYIEHPVGEAERARLVDDLRAAMRSPADRQLALDTLDELVRSDGIVTDEERQVVESIKREIAQEDVSVFGAFKRLFAGPIQRRSAAADAPNREAFLDDFIHNKVFFTVQQRLRLEDGALSIPEDKLRKLSLAAGVMARVARIDSGVDESEFQAIVAALQTDWGITETEATLVATAATSKHAESLDHFRTARQFFEVCTQEELVAFARVLFDIAAADGMVTRDEIEEIRTISRTLLLSHKQFIEAKTSIPREKREE